MKALVETFNQEKGLERAWEIFANLRVTFVFKLYYIDISTHCVQGEPECVYTEGRLPAEDNLVTGDSRRQMGQFCGQHTYCDRCSSCFFIAYLKPGGKLCEVWTELLSRKDQMSMIPIFKSKCIFMFS